jgi:TATA-box binding protein (TBP) (component of TFIID and TFIIIB)
MYKVFNANKESKMKLNQVLSIVNQVEKSEFITSLDKLSLDAAESNKKLAKTIENIDGQIKNASGSEITQLYFAVKDFFQSAVKEQILNLNQLSLNLTINKCKDL